MKYKYYADKLFGWLFEAMPLPNLWLAFCNVRFLLIVNLNFKFKYKCEFKIKE